MKKRIEKSARKIINQYMNLPLNGKKVPCPYYINIKKLRMGLRVLIGKGTPEEIVQESLIYEKLRGVDFSKMTVDEIRTFMVKRHIGIDCSAFVTHVLDFWLINKGKKHLWRYLKYPKQNIYRWFARKLRPVVNISVTLLTEDLNSYQVKNLDNLECGDLIRLKGIKFGYHVMLVDSIERDNGKVTEFTYIQATRWYEDKHGVRKGKVIVKNPKAPLHKQEWIDEYKGKNWTYEGICKDKDYSQVRRLKNVPIY